ncbi:hypothetical protein D1AOALGA4SA_2675 [Olavius algarvensis Delta 1 endosymbiont]|nr:hypothetical protein D1AOALGA4SA_2675 [Olavius algarvensis Delta 1 endosymbiont]
MNKLSASAKSILLKAVCTAMVIILGGSLFAAGAMGAEGCGMKCCCQTGPSHVQSSAEKQMRSPMGCCAGVPLSPCDIQAARPLELPEIILASSCDYLPEISGTAVMINPAGDQRKNSGAKFISQVLDPKFNSPPLYLQNSSFLI